MRIENNSFGNQTNLIIIINADSNKERNDNESVFKKSKVIKAIRRSLI